MTHVTEGKKLLYSLSMTGLEPPPGPPRTTPGSREQDWADFLTKI